MTRAELLAPLAAVALAAAIIELAGAVGVRGRRHSRQRRHTGGALVAVGRLLGASASGPPELRAQLDAADAVLFSTPEYAGALPGSFKNLLDWTVGGGTYGKPVAWVNTSSSPTGAASAHDSLRTVLRCTGTDIVEPACVRIPVPRKTIGRDGLVADVAVREQIAAVLEALAEHIKGLRGSA